MLEKNYFCAFCQFTVPVNDSSTNLEECSCHLVRYCGPDCQGQDWSSHQELCERRQKDLQELELSKVNVMIAWEIFKEIAAVQRETKNVEAHDELSRQITEILTFTEDCRKQNEVLSNRLLKETFNWAVEHQDYQAFEAFLHYCESGSEYRGSMQDDVDGYDHDARYIYVLFVLEKVEKLSAQLNEYSCLYYNHEFSDAFKGLLGALLSSGFPELNGPYQTFQEIAMTAPKGSLINELYAKGIPMEVIEDQCQMMAEEKFDIEFATRWGPSLFCANFYEDPWYHFILAVEYAGAMGFMNTLCNVSGEEDEYSDEYATEEETETFGDQAELFRKLFQKYPKVYKFLCKSWKAASKAYVWYYPLGTPDCEPEFRGPDRRLVPDSWIPPTGFFERSNSDSDF